MRNPVPIAIALAILLAARAAQAAAPVPEVPRAATPLPFSAPVAPETLDSMRGGFTGQDGLAVSFSLERVVTVDGQPVAQSALQLGDLGRLVAGQTTLSVPDGIFIQNSLNNRIIDHATVINASVDARGMLQTMHFASTLANALNLAVTSQR
jgi:hypothetical protein